MPVPQNSPSPSPNKPKVSAFVYMDLSFSADLEWTNIQGTADNSNESYLYGSSSLQ